MSYQPKFRKENNAKTKKESTQSIVLSNSIHGNSVSECVSEWLSLGLFLSGVAEPKKLGS
jgi:hypothetical protein